MAGFVLGDGVLGVVSLSPDFSAGITVATFGPRQNETFEHFGELIAELFKLAALLVLARSRRRRAARPAAVRGGREEGRGRGAAVDQRPREMANASTP